MSKKPPIIERELILLNDQRRKYGAELTFQVQRSAYIGDLENATLLLPDGTLATISPKSSLEWEGLKKYEIRVLGFRTASDAELAGMKIVQSLLTTAISLDFGLRLQYKSHEPATVYDRTISRGFFGEGEGYVCWPQEVFLNEFFKDFSTPPQDRRLLLSMELFASASLESNERAKFVMAVSALEPLAEQMDLGPDVSSAIDSLAEELKRQSIPAPLKDSIRGRLLQLKRESIRQALKRLCNKWFPDNTVAWSTLDRAYSLRSELLHEGRPNDLDILIHQELQKVKNYLRLIYQQECNQTFYAKPMI